ncbi:nitronate monooxygenase [Cupriavidus oxalaticus]|uniref:Nitronate monooxygenase n=1 Tax=Cupriavidus oxalaticus TaxID=96344 RepID=A0A5P3VCH8_9BURK|nr:nitronate monooxygenase [Cupriavidus oxalaticus]QEZ43950.1 nitronate monooxygenase [Cupriavidus oxalaticus]
MFPHQDAKPGAPPLRTRITELLDIDYPILAGGLMWLSDARYVAALARAGAMAFITPRSFDGPEAYRAALRDCSRMAGDRPFGVNITQSRRAAENAMVAAWIDMALEHGVRCFETVGPSPERLIAQIHAGGAKAIHKSAFVEHALKAEQAGADAVALVGAEAGGHPGTNELPSFLCGALALQRLTVPMALGGGIGDGRQIAAALALGADAVVMGTRFLVSEEIWAHENYKRHLVEQPAEASTLAMRASGNPWRVLDNATVREIERLEQQGARHYAEFGALATGRLGRDHCYRQGDWNTGLLSMGPAIGFADAIEPAASIVARLMAQATQAASRLASMATPVPAVSADAALASRL